MYKGGCHFHARANNVKAFDGDVAWTGVDSQITEVSEDPRTHVVSFLDLTES